MIADNYFYKTIVELASKQGYTIKELATICEIQPHSLARQLTRVEGCGLSGVTCMKLRDELAPHLTIDELFPKVFRYLSEELADCS